MENNIQELIEGFKTPVMTFYSMFSNLNYKVVGEFLFIAGFFASVYLFCYCWVYFCIKVSDNANKAEVKENKWTSTK
jgi:hypothetical protein